MVIETSWMTGHDIIALGESAAPPYSRYRERNRLGRSKALLSILNPAEVTPEELEKWRLIYQSKALYLEGREAASKKPPPTEGIASEDAYKIWKVSSKKKKNMNNTSSTLEDQEVLGAAHTLQELSSHVQPVSGLPPRSNRTRKPKVLDAIALPEPPAKRAKGPSTGTLPFVPHPQLLHFFKIATWESGDVKPTSQDFKKAHQEASKWLTSQEALCAETPNEKHARLLLEQAKAALTAQREEKARREKETAELLAATDVLLASARAELVALRKK
jgi:hypothetical protein